MLHKIEAVALVGGRYFRIAEEETPIYIIELFTGITPRIDEDSRTFRIFGWPLECFDHGLRMPVRVPATRIDDGLTLWWQTPRCWYEHRLDGWGIWLDTMEANGMPRATVTTARDADALSWLVRFRHWALQRAAEQVIQVIEDGELGLDGLLERMPELEHVEVFRDYVAKKALTGKLPKRGVGKRGKDPKTRRAVIELYTCARALRDGAPGLSWDAAYEMACNMYPEWIPKTWKSDDPAGQLKKMSAWIKGSRWAP